MDMMDEIMPEARPHLLSPDSEHDSFVQDDLEFRTITTILNALECRDKITLRNFEVVPKLKPHLKILSALSSLLVRDHETVAILPKHSQRGITMLIGSDASLFDNEDSSVSTPTSLSGRLSHDVNQDSRKGNRFGRIEITQPSVVTVGLNVEGFIMENWNQSFEHHVQAFSDLLNTAIKNPSNTTANALKRYSTFRSAPKINRRLRNSVVLRGLKKIDLADDTTRTLGILSAAEFNKMAVALYRDHEGRILHEKLYDYLTNPGSRFVPPSLHLFHRFLTWLLSVLADEISFLCKLQGEEPPDTFPVAEVKNAMLHLELLQYLAWESVFFADYMGMVCPNGRGQQEFSDNIIDTTGPLSREPGEQDRGGDIGTEFETGQDYVPESGLQSTHASHPWILELRLITSNIYQLKTLLGWTPSRELVTFSFQLIKYGRSGPLLKPWRELLHELFPISSEEDDVLRALEKLSENRDRRYNSFRANGPPLQFRGEAHCEAVLGCLYTLARTERAADISWAKIPRSVLRAAENTYSLLAISKRCCPVCETIILYLQPEYGRPLHALSTQSIVLPCALPIGLPRGVRQRLLVTYRMDLKTRLRELVRWDQSSASASSAQSQPISDHGKNEEQSPHLENKDNALALMSDWVDMPIATVTIEWEELKSRPPGAVADACWWYMPDEYKSALAKP